MPFTTQPFPISTGDRGDSGVPPRKILRLSTQARQQLFVDEDDCAAHGDIGIPPSLLSGAVGEEDAKSIDSPGRLVVVDEEICIAETDEEDMADNTDDDSDADAIDARGSHADDADGPREPGSPSHGCGGHRPCYKRKGTHFPRPEPQPPSSAITFMDADNAAQSTPGEEAGRLLEIAEKAMRHAICILRETIPSEEACRVVGFNAPRKMIQDFVTMHAQKLDRRFWGTDGPIGAMLSDGTVTPETRKDAHDDFAARSDRWLTIDDSVEWLSNGGEYRYCWRPGTLDRGDLIMELALICASANLPRATFYRAVDSFDAIFEDFDSLTPVFMKTDIAEDDYMLYTPSNTDECRPLDWRIRMLAYSVLYLCQDIAVGADPLTTEYLLRAFRFFTAENMEAATSLNPPYFAMPINWNGTHLIKVHCPEAVPHPDRFAEAQERRKTDRQSPYLMDATGGGLDHKKVAACFMATINKLVPFCRTRMSTCPTLFDMGRRIGATTDDWTTAHDELLAALAFVHATRGHEDEVRYGNNQLDVTCHWAYPDKLRMAAGLVATTRCRVGAAHQGSSPWTHADKLATGGLEWTDDVRPVAKRMNSLTVCAPVTSYSAWEDAVARLLKVSLGTLFMCDIVGKNANALKTMSCHLRFSRDDDSDDALVIRKGYPYYS